MTRRQSTSSDISSTFSSSTTIYSPSKVDGSPHEEKHGNDIAKDSATTTTTAAGDAPPSKEQKKNRRGFRQKAKDVVHDLGSPPTRRQDCKDGKPTRNYSEVGLMGGVVSGGQLPTL